MGLSLTLAFPSATSLGAASIAWLAIVLDPNYPRQHAWQLMQRLRWFLLSLIIFFGWIDPVHGPSLQPSLSGLSEGLLRCAALLILVGWVAWLTTAFSRPALIAALTLLLFPLRIVGADTARFAKILFLTLDYFAAQPKTWPTEDATGGTRLQRFKQRLLQARNLTIQHLAHILAASTTTTPSTIHAAAPATPTPNTLWPLLLLWVTVALGLTLRR